jgi:hypothetical protein
MKSVFDANTGLEAHMILNLLEQHRITGRIDGEYLQGGIGELQAMGFVRVMVAEENYEQAKQIVNEWEAIQPPNEIGRSPTQDTLGIQLFFAGIIIGAALMYGLLKHTSA